ncbi:MAG: pyruvate, phosphate dikinase, partial [Clostridia bacterium]|nr:pyruvate, phosphate dikinase [Clostridia bacterium]
MSVKYVYLFQEGDAGMRDLLGGKGADLAEMTRIGLPVPPGLIITTEACREYVRRGQELPPGLMAQVEEKLAAVEAATGKKFGDPVNPLLLSVRSGAPVSMPGMMDTILNLGLNDVTVEGLAKAAGDERFALDCYRRFLQMFGNVVLGVEHEIFERELERLKREEGVRFDHELSPPALRRLLEAYKRVIRAHAGRDFPQEPREQLELA